MSWLVGVDWVAVLRLFIGMGLSVMFFRLYTYYDSREIAVRLLRSTHENKTARDLNHSSRYVVRLVFSVSLGLLVGGVSWSTLPATLAVGGAGYLIFDPALNLERDKEFFYSSDGNNWDKFWLWLTKRPNEAGRWSAYVEAVLLLANIIWFICLSHISHH